MLHFYFIYIYIFLFYIYIYTQGEFYFVCQSFYHAGDYRLHNKLIGTYPRGKCRCWKTGPILALISAAKRWQTMLSRCWLIVGFIMSHKKKDNKNSWHSVTLLYLTFIGPILVTTAAGTGTTGSDIGSVLGRL